jgi:hypothetical protein
MRDRLVRLILGVGVMLATSQVAPAQSPNQTKPAGVKPAAAKAPGEKPNLAGVWQSRNTPVDFANPKGPSVGTSGGWDGVKRSGGGFGFLDLKMQQPQMLPWAEARFKAIRQGAYDYMQPLKPVAPNINCLPSGFPEVMDMSMVEILQTPKKIVMLFSSGGEWRQIFMDGRKNPEGAPDTFMGYSTGKWDGDTLVIETSGISDLTWIDIIGHMHSDALRVEERIRRVASDRLDVDLLFDDPKTYVKPWKGKKVYFLQKPDVDVMEGFACDQTWRKEYPEKLRKEIGETKGP